ncbi:uncharacterized protein LOC112564776 isoform X2 [Pomacea canaliculata]|uniref:uncharacterized protein LOC112564776 isoform X2 n=1 Tax=Pomacea canaliculata TaxID=400727 RepID=UPI000D73826E|nr:uncharacterized protein LOC112564776 isoform X2 [Pomacea canaliculata]
MSGMLSSALTSFPRPTAVGERRCYGMSSAVPGSPSPPSCASTPSSTSVRVGSPGGSGGPLSTSPGGGGWAGVGAGACGGSGYTVPSGCGATIAPDIHMQKAVLEQLLERSLSEGDFWYVVVAEWLEHLKKYLGIASTRKYYQKRVTTLPGPIVTRRDFAHTVDVVHEDAWRMLIQWYGLAEGHKPMRLVVYRYARGPEIEHNLNTFKLMLTTSPPEDFHNVRFSKMEKLGHIECRLRQLYAVPVHKETRLWARVEPDNEWRPLVARDKCVGRALDMDSDFTRPVIALEIQDDDHMWSRPPEGISDSFFAPGDLNISDASPGLPQSYPVGPLYENSIFDDITTVWEGDIHDQIDNLGKSFVERLHSNFAVFVQRARDYVSDREAHLRERERQINARESVTERLAFRLEEKEKRLAEELGACEDKIKEYERRRLELEKDMADRREETERLLKEQREQLEMEARCLETRREHFNEEIKRMTELHVIQEGRVKLDIGGNHFTTSLLTLTKESESMLSAMFSGRHPLKTEADGSYFIDRDGTHFRYILNYLRDGCIKEGTLPSSDTVLRELLTEAEYYQLSGLADILGSLLSKQDTVKSDGES